MLATCTLCSTWESVISSCVHSRMSDFHNLLARFPRGLPPSLESLHLQENRITYITAGALRQLGNLTRLDLEDNRIRAIQPGALQGLNKLQVLTLKGNKLTSLPQNLPPSLTHLDLSANCISALDLPSLSALVNLQVLRINSNCLRSVPDSAFDSLPRLRSVDLTDNMWVCECDILYLYRWLLSGRLKMATDLVCTEPDHLAHRLLLNLSVMAICPHKSIDTINTWHLNIWSFLHEIKRLTPQPWRGYKGYKTPSNPRRVQDLIHWLVLKYQWDTPY
uniref:Si:ch211-191d15.2 n=1 Tax=Seriola dumerili TaxID=41447 RepID=A0A3B4UC72_SERDU